MARSRKSEPQPTAPKTAPASEPATKLPPHSDNARANHSPVYRADDLREFSEARDLGEPGKFPFTRGIHPTMYRERLWTMRQYAGYGTAEESNRRYRYLLRQGQKGLSVAFDLPTQLGMDSDHPLAAGEVGKVGVAINSLRDMETLFDEMALGEISTSMTINSTAAILLALYAAVARKQGASLKKLSGTVQNDILKEYIARGTYIFPPRPSLRLITDMFAWCEREMPEWNVISVSGYHIREAGSTAVQEIAFTLADGIAYLEAAREAGLSIEHIARQVSFFFNAHNGLLEEVAKYRAARRLWARIMKDKFHVDDPRAQMLRFHTQTAGSSLTAQQPDVNVVRTTIQALAAVLGGTQSLHTNSKDEALGLPTQQAALLALRTQQVIAYESGVPEIVDPLAGSYYIESLTNDMEAGAREYIAGIEERGGMLRCIETGFVQREIQQAAFRYQQAVERGEQVVVGINRFADVNLSADDKYELPVVLRVDPALERKQVERLRILRAERNAARVSSTLEQVERAARGADNLMPPILNAVEALATVGEISDALRKVFGEYREAVVV